VGCGRRPPAAGGGGGRRLLRVSGCLGSGFQSPAVLEVGRGRRRPGVGCGLWAARPGGGGAAGRVVGIFGGRCRRRGSVIGAARAGCGQSSAAERRGG
jgi:hypothetical protein